MLPAFHRLCISLIFSLVLNFAVGADTGCDTWSFSEQKGDVCCDKCKPGNHLVKKCGRDLERLCTPCESGTYTTSPNVYSCSRCTQCIGIQFTVKNCTISSDTVCGCKHGYRCGNGKCSFCVTECKEGEEPTKERSCRKCPEGKFNDKIHSMCKELRKSCPDGKTLRKGNVTSDSTCTNSVPEEETLAVVTNNKKEQTNWLPVFIAGGMAGLAILCIIASVVAYVKGRNKKEEKPKNDTPKQDGLEESRIMLVEQEDCSFRHPEQEQGGSSESIDSQDSESKLIV